MQDPNDPDTFNIFVATDNHLGFKDQDPVRGNDSFDAMDEIFRMAADADLLLLGGDLFHENKPTRHCMHRTIEMFRKYCLQDRPIKFNVVSDPVSCVTFISLLRRDVVLLRPFTARSECVHPRRSAGQNFQTPDGRELPRSTLRGGIACVHHPWKSRRSTA